MNFERFRNLSAHHRALVAVSVLFDGYEASMFLADDQENGALLSDVAKEIASLKPAFRNYISAHYLRTALEDLAQRNEES